MVDRWKSSVSSQSTRVFAPVDQSELRSACHVDSATAPCPEHHNDL